MTCETPEQQFLPIFYVTHSTLPFCAFLITFDQETSSNSFFIFTFKNLKGESLLNKTEPIGVSIALKSGCDYGLHKKSYNCSNLSPTTCK